MRALIIAAILIFVAAAGSLFYFNRKITGADIAVDFNKQPTMGDMNAKVHVVVFTDPKCPTCKTFQEYFLPLLKKNYIDKGLASFTEIPVALIPGSELLASAWLCVYNESPGAPHPDRYFRFVQVSFENQGPVRLNWADETAILRIARSASSKINIDNLKFCVENLKYADQVGENTAFLKKNLGGRVVVPAVFVNGRYIEKISLTDIEDEIKRQLEKNK